VDRSRRSAGAGRCKPRKTRKSDQLTLARKG
jgi:hypothetical protein